MAGPVVSSISPHLRTLDAPEELRQLQGWLIWRHEQFPGEEKPRKVPYYVNGGKRYGRQGGPEDRAKLTTFAMARDTAAKRGFDGVGLALMPEWGISALDFDKCVDASGNLPTEIEDIVSRTYAEYSPSGTGVRAFVKGNLGNHKSFQNETNPWGLEVFSSNGFVTVTGNVIPSTEFLGLENHIDPVGEPILNLCSARFGANRAQDDGEEDPFAGVAPILGVTPDEINDYLSDIDPGIGRHAWIKVGMALYHETAGDGFDVWDAWSEGSDKYPGREALKAQWASFGRKHPDQTPVTFATIKMLSNEARAANGLEPRTIDISRVAELAREAAPKDIDPAVYTTPLEYRGKYLIVGANAFASRPPPPWIIKHVLPKADLGVLYGPSGSGKSFIALDMAISVARGAPWRGKKVKQGRVLLIAAEGGGGVPQRLRAYGQHHDVDLSSIPLGIIHAAPNLLVEDDVAELVKAIISAGSGDLIIIDTFAQTTPGANENSGEDMGKALRNARAIRDATGSMVLLVHHSGKDAARGARGWSGIKAAADVEFEVIRPEEGDIRTLRVSKQKDGADDLAWGFKLESVMIGLDEDDEEITSLVVLDAEVPQPKSEEPLAPRRKMGIWETVVMDFIATLPDVSGMMMDELVSGAVSQVPAPNAGERDFRAQNVRRAIASLGKGIEPPLLIAHGRVEFGAMVKNDD